MRNKYSKHWYTTFLHSIAAESTQVEVAFIERVMPSNRFPHLLDLCCGPGRHAALLTEKGYRILGIDANRRAVQQARTSAPQARFQVGDMRNLHSLRETYDGVVNLWHSFGYFDDQTNEDILRQVRNVLCTGGRALFDVYNREHFARRPPLEIAERNGKTIRTTHSWHGFRHRVVLEYDGRVQDEFEWRLYTPGEFEEMCRATGLNVLVKCAWFDESIPAAPEHARMQILLERPA